MRRDSNSHNRMATDLQSADFTHLPSHRLKSRQAIGFHTCYVYQTLNTYLLRGRRRTRSPNSLTCYLVFKTSRLSMSLLHLPFRERDWIRTSDFQGCNLLPWTTRTRVHLVEILGNDPSPSDLQSDASTWLA